MAPAATNLDGTYAAKSWFRNMFIELKFGTLKGRWACIPCLVSQYENNPLPFVAAPAAAGQRRERGEDEEQEEVRPILNDTNTVCDNSMKKHLKTHKNPEIPNDQCAEYKRLLDKWKATNDLKKHTREEALQPGTGLVQAPLNLTRPSDISLLPITDLVMHLIASSASPFALMENPFLREILRRGNATGVLDKRAVGDNIARVYETEVTRLNGMQRAKMHQDQRRYAFLAVDGGTVWTRYMGVVLHIPGFAPIVAALTADYYVDPEGAADQGAAMTIVNLSNYLNTLIEETERKFKVIIGGVVTDNAPNMVGMAESMKRLPMRCACHGLQLMVKPYIEHIKAIGDEVGEWWEEYGEVLAKVAKQRLVHRCI